MGLEVPSQAFDGSTTGASLEVARDLVRRGGLRGTELLRWIASFTPRDRDRAVERLLGIELEGSVPSPPSVTDPEAGGTPTGVEDEERFGYIPSGVAPIVTLALDAPLHAGDRLVDLGSGLGKVALLAHLLTGARCHGVELNGGLVERARGAAASLHLEGVTFEQGDAATAPIEDGTLYFLYLPFLGVTLRRVLARLEAVTLERPIVIATLGLDLPPLGWLRRRPLEAFWLDIYDCGPGPNRDCGPFAGALAGTPELASLARSVAEERAVAPGSGHLGTSGV